jgi:deoxyribose-phosphate aldolase
VGFPFGATPPEVKSYEAQRALGDGASEIDMVINVGALKSGDRELVQRDIEIVVELCRHSDAQSKVIIETALLTDNEKRLACELAKAAKADFVKTSTGFGPGGATVADVRLMRSIVGDALGVKAAGGVRDYDTFKALTSAGATRIGASAGVKIVMEALGA